MIGPTLKEAILELDWSKVCKVYKTLTGETINPPQISETNYISYEEIKKQIIRILDSLINASPTPIIPNPVIPPPLNPITPVIPVANYYEEQDEADEEPIKPQSQFDKFKIEHKGIKQTDEDKSFSKALPFEKPEGPNKFVDDKSLCINDLNIDSKLTAKLNPSQRETREPTKLVDVTCCKCSNKYSVLPIFAPKKYGKDDEGKPYVTLYTCDNCIGRR